MQGNESGPRTTSRRRQRMAAVAMVGVLVVVAAVVLVALFRDRDDEQSDQTAAAPAPTVATSVTTPTSSTAPSATTAATPDDADPPPTATGTVAIMQTATIAPPSVTAAAPTPTIPLATYGNAEIYIINIDGSDERNITNATTAESMPMWSPDGTRIGYRSSTTYGHGGGVYAMLPDGTRVGELLPASTYGYQELAWLTDERLAFMTCGGAGMADCGVFTGDVGDVNRQRLPAPEGGYDEIAWSPDGTRIVYINSHSGNDNLFVMTIADGSIRQLTDTTGDEGMPAWSPDGRSIAYTRWDANDDWSVVTSSLLVIDADADGAEPRTVFASEEAIRQPAWSPDGGQFVFAYGSGLDTNLWIIAADGSGLRQLTSALHTNEEPAWSPDGRQIAFVSTRDGGQPVACSFSAMASMTMPEPMETQAWQVHAIVVGTIVEELAPTFGSPREGGWDETPLISTDYLLEVERQFRGHAFTERVRLRVMGGTIGDCVQTNEPSVKLSVGDRLLLFLYPARHDPLLPDAYYPSVQGAWSVTANDTIVTPDFAFNPPGYDGLTLDEVGDLIAAALSGDPPPDHLRPVPLEEAPLTEATP